VALGTPVLSSVPILRVVLGLGVWCPFVSGWYVVVCLSSALFVVLGGLMFWEWKVVLMLLPFVLVSFFSLGCFVCLVLSLPFLHPFPFQRCGFCLYFGIRSSARSLLFFSCVLLLFSEGGWVSCLLCRVVCHFVWLTGPTRSLIVGCGTGRRYSFCRRW